MRLDVLWLDSSDSLACLCLWLDYFDCLVCLCVLGLNPSESLVLMLSPSDSLNCLVVL